MDNRGIIQFFSDKSLGQIFVNFQNRTGKKPISIIIEIRIQRVNNVGNFTTGIDDTLKTKANILYQVVWSFRINFKKLFDFIPAKNQLRNAFRLGHNDIDIWIISIK